MRRSEKALQAQADFNVLNAEKNKYPLVFSRSLDNEQIIVALNPAGSDVTIEIPAEISDKPALIAGASNKIKRNGTKIVLEMKGVTYSVFKLKK
jgi:hypothetical protein